MGWFDDPKEYERLKNKNALTSEQRKAREADRRANDPQWERWEAMKRLADENNATRKLAERAGGFTSKSEADRDEAFEQLVKKHGKRRAKKLIEDAAISGGAKPKSVLRRFTGW